MFESHSFLLPENQDMEPLDEQADERDDAIHPENDTDQDPVEDTDEQFKTACIMLKCKELCFVSVFSVIESPV